MSDAGETPLHFFVDEAGDPTLFSGEGRILVGEPGCSSYFILGRLEVVEPDKLEQALTDLRADLLADPYFKRVPSMQPERRKTAVAFHSKDDVAEVRHEVFKLLLNFDLRFSAVVRNKFDLLAYVQQRNELEADYRYKGDELYDSLVQELFRRFRRINADTRICFAKRGNKARTQAFRAAIEDAENEFERQYGFRRAPAQVIASTPKRSAGLQAVDYFLWALQRHYERNESRYVELIWPKVVEVHDMDRIERGRTGVTYNQKRPLFENNGRED